MNPSIAFIGGGNMASSLIGGMLAAGTPADSILVAEPSNDQRENLSQQFAINTSASNLDALAYDVVVLAVKPQVLQMVCRELAKAENVARPLYVSIAAGIRSNSIKRWLGGEAAIVRCMPNTPALLQCGATALYANDAVSEEQSTQAENILRAAGITTWVDNEALIDAVTAVSGSGPAYFFLLMEAMQSAGVELGLDSETAKQLSLQTALGAARMATESDVSPAELRARVTSKGGTTAAAIASFEANGFNQIVSEALRAAYNRSAELAEELGQDNE